MMRAMKLLIALSLLGLAGCIELLNTVTVNPDGSGKALVQITGAPMPEIDFSGKGGPPKQPDPAKQARDFLKQQIQSGKGVEAWSDLSCEAAPDGRMVFKGTAYFADVSKFQVGLQSSSGLSWKPDAKGGMVLAIAADKDETDGPASRPAPVKALTDDQVKAEILRARQKWLQGKPMFQMILGGLKIDQTYILPGKIEQVAGFKQTDKGVQSVFEGQKAIEVIDKFMADDEALAQSIKTGKDPMDRSEMRKTVSSSLAVDLSARVSGPLKPQFDYKAELEKAKAAWPEQLKKLGLTEEDLKKSAFPFKIGPGGDDGPPPERP